MRSVCGLPTCCASLRASFSTVPVFLSVCRIPDQKTQVLGKTAFISGRVLAKDIFLNNAARYQVFIAVSRGKAKQSRCWMARIAKKRQDDDCRIYPRLDQ